MPAVPRDAATLILVRNTLQSSDGFEVLLLRRHVKSEFMPDAYVFPGGSLEASDYDRQVETICHGLNFQQAHDIIRDVSAPEKALGFFVVAIRETFEEAGIILAGYAGDPWADIGVEQKNSLNEYRKQKKKDPFAFHSAIKDAGLKINVGNLHYFAHWITPEIAPMRFDTRFFVAVAPGNQEADKDSIEVTDHIWLTPQQVIEQQKSGLPVPFATLSNMKALAQFSGIKELIDSTRGKKVSVVQPTVTFENGEMKIRL